MLWNLCTPEDPAKNLYEPFSHPPTEGILKLRKFFRSPDSPIEHVEGTPKSWNHPPFFYNVTKVRLAWRTWANQGPGETCHGKVEGIHWGYIGIIGNALGFLGIMENILGLYKDNGQ